MRLTRRTLLGTTVGFATSIALGGTPTFAASAREIDQAAEAALNQLYATAPNTKTLGNKAKAILIFPKITKAGLVLGGLSGDGALRVANKTVGYYNVSAGSFGLQAGAEQFAYALFFMTDSGLSYLKSSNGWAIGTGPSVVIVDKGGAASITTTTLSQDVYAVPFAQSGLMAGLTLEGSKITHISPGN
jgi:lipid-binding SYLF domain-containing protein